MDSELRRELETVGLRLGETMEALAAERSINDLGSTDDTLKLELERHGHFWNAALLAFQTTWFTGIWSLLDSNKNSATLYSILKKAKTNHSDPAFVKMEISLKVIEERYKEFRHKLFAHNDKNRLHFIEQFDAQGFSAQQSEDDTLYLDYVWKAVWLVNDGKPIPSEAEAVTYRFSQNDWAGNVERHTKSMLTDKIKTQNST